MIPKRQDDPIAYARFWMGDLFPLLQERAAQMRLSMQSGDVPEVPTAQGLKRLNKLVDRQLLIRRARKENGAYIFVPVDFLAEHFLSEVAERAAQAAKQGEKT